MGIIPGIPSGYTANRAQLHTGSGQHRAKLLLPQSHFKTRVEDRASVFGGKGVGGKKENHPSPASFSVPRGHLAPPAPTSSNTEMR
jgi:hypothetical protein